MSLGSLWKRLSGLVGVGRGAEAQHTRIEVSRRRAGGVGVFEVAVFVPRSRAGHLIDALCCTAGEVATVTGLNVASVGLVPGEPPRLAVRAPQRDLVADALETQLTATEVHRTPTLWLLLQPGTYVAEVLDPDSPLDPDDALIASWIDGGSVAGAARVEIEPASYRLTARFVLYGPPLFLRRCVRVARTLLRVLPGWERAKNTSPGTANSSENAKLHK